MRRRSERSLLLLGLFFVFACLLISGGSRLIGHEMQEDSMPMQRGTLIAAAFSAMPAPLAQLSDAPARGEEAQRAASGEVEERGMFIPVLACDANGNVLRGRSYLHEVYQVFSLGDGFV